MQPIITCLVAGLQYLIHPQKIGSIQETINPDVLLPVTLLTTDEIFGDLDGILDLLDDYDDVFTPDFGSVLIEKPGPGQSNASQLDSFNDRPSRQLYQLEGINGRSNGFSELPSGPYFLHGPNLHQAWRLYNDDLDAFTFGVIPDNPSQPNEFQVLASLSSQGDSKSIAVPSRLYHPRPSPRKPLSGIRISINDFMSLNGTQSSLSSRAWASLYSSAAATTAEFAQKLIDLGAVIVGKTKASQLGTGVEWVDEQAPWTPRGDGYRVISGNSVGAAAGLAGYEWLQRSIGSDDRGLSAQHGVYSIAPSPESASQDGILHFSRPGNTRLFSRSLEDLLTLTISCLSINSPKTSLPERIIYPIDLHSSFDTSPKPLMSEVFVALERFLGVEVEPVSLEKIWNETRPEDAHDEGMQLYMKEASFQSWCYEYYHASEDFRSQYSDKFHKQPFVEATPQFLWNVGKLVTKSKYEEHLNHLKIYRKWFHKHIMAIDSTPNAEVIMILPCGSSESRYRDEPTMCVLRRLHPPAQHD